MVRAFVVAPAQVHAHHLGRDAGERVVERRDVHAGALAKLRQVKIRILDVPPHGEIGTIDLQHDPGLRDRLVFVPHRICDRKQIKSRGPCSSRCGKNSDTTPGEAALMKDRGGRRPRARP